LGVLSGIEDAAGDNEGVGGDAVAEGPNERMEDNSKKVN
jgi:hypothetical protein